MSALLCLSGASRGAAISGASREAAVSGVAWGQPEPRVGGEGIVVGRVSCARDGWGARAVGSGVWERVLRVGTGSQRHRRWPQVEVGEVLWRQQREQVGVAL